MNTGLFTEQVVLRPGAAISSDNTERDDDIASESLNLSDIMSSSFSVLSLKTNKKYCFTMIGFILQ